MIPRTWVIESFVALRKSCYVMYMNILGPQKSIFA